jgi:sugar phosphate isomerase/epimerase
MKIAFTTLGCPDWDVSTIIQRATEYGYDGVDFRVYRWSVDLAAFPEFGVDAKETARRFGDAGLEVPCFSTSVNLRGNPAAENLRQVQWYAQLCTVFGARQLRVFGGGTPAPRRQAIDELVSAIKPLLKVTRDHNVVLLLETHDQWTESARIREVMEQVASPSLGVLWDVHHPWRESHESLDYTWDTIGRWVANTHWKDADANNKLTLVGEGVLPLAAWHGLLKRNGYQGFCTLEWEKHWHKELADPEIALPCFSRFMRELGNA